MMNPDQIERAVNQWHTPPEDQGQTVELAYGADWESDTLVLKRTDKATGEVTYYTAGSDRLPSDGDWQPWNHRPMIRWQDWREVEN